MYNRITNQFEFGIKGWDKLALADEAIKPAVSRAAVRLSLQIRDRIDKQGKDHKGNKLPSVQKRSGWYWTGVYDPRFRSKDGFSFNRPYKEAPLRLVYWRGYKALKSEMNGGRTWRGASLTGKMWQNMTVNVKAGARGADSIKLIIGFAKGERVGSVPNKDKPGKKKSVYIRNRKKAEMLQYNKRSGRTGKPKGQAFVLMQPSDAEIGLMLQLMSAGIRFANSR